MHKVGAKNKRSGNSLEAATAKQFSKWYGKGFHRSPGSGALGWTEINVSADVLPPNDLDFPFIIECKSDKSSNWNIENFMNSNKHFPVWSAQAVREGINTDSKVPLLVFKRNYVHSYISFPYTSKVVNKIEEKSIPYAVSFITYTSEIDKKTVKYKCVAIMLDYLLDMFSTKEFEDCFDNTWISSIDKEDNLIEDGPPEDKINKIEF